MLVEENESFREENSTLNLKLKDEKLQLKNALHHNALCTYACFMYAFYHVSSSHLSSGMSNGSMESVFEPYKTANFSA